MIKFFNVLIVAVCFTSPLLSQQKDLLLGNSEPKTIFINNRILAKVNSKAISVIDVMKKMDFLFYRQFPEYAAMLEARYQFYEINWRHMLQDIVDKELILSDAEEKKLNVNAADIRQELELTFGPNIIVNLDKAGITFEEAWKILQEDITIRRMLALRVHSKALKKVTPQAVRKAYEEYCKENIRPDEWVYRVITIRDQESSKASEAASFAYDFLTVQKRSIDELADTIQANEQFKDSVRITISEVFHHPDKELSPLYKEALESLVANNYSQPSQHKSKDNNTVFRIFYLKEKNQGGVVPFHEVENELREKVLQQAIVEATSQYIKGLHDHYDIKESYLSQLIPNDFMPFLLK